MLDDEYTNLGASDDTVLHATTSTTTHINLHLHRWLLIPAESSE
jgi:hypothetical protein